MLRTTTRSRPADDDDDEDIPYRLEPVKEIKALRSGDQLAICGEHEGHKYYHHGIYLGPKEGIIDFGGMTKMDARPRLVDIVDFLSGRPQQNLVRIVYPAHISLPVDEVVTTARQFLLNPWRWGRFNLLENNCEHFATYCKTGRKVSSQVAEKMREAIDGIAVGLGVVLVGGALLLGAAWLLSAAVDNDDDYDLGRLRRRF